MGQLCDDITAKTYNNDAMVCVQFINDEIHKLVKHDPLFASVADVSTEFVAIYDNLRNFITQEGISVSFPLWIWLSGHIYQSLVLCREICEGHKHYSSP